MTNTMDKRIGKVARKMAKMVIALRAEGKLEAAAKLETAATETCDRMYEDRL